MNLREVRRWALWQGLSASQFRQFYADAFLVAISSLLRAIHREGLAELSSVCHEADGNCTLRIGREPSLVTPLARNLPFERIEAIGPPRFKRNGTEQIVCATRAFQRALRTALGASEIIGYFDRVISDFDNSFANLVLNRVLFYFDEPTSPRIEPSYQGHSIHPFPALRKGPSLDLITKCSHLSGHDIELTLVGAQGAKFLSISYSDYQSCAGDWMGRTFDSGRAVFIPVHPWQLALSSVVRRVLDLGILSVADDSVRAMPLASQRTCRIVTTGYDVKMPIDATLTGEHRLLYPANVQNAPTISALTKAALGYSAETTINFQYDIASVLHPDALIGTHLSAIIRSPVPEYPGQQVVPALNLWSGRVEAHRLLKIDTPASAEEVFASYCRVLIRGPVEFYARFGIALEPHLQNVLIRIRDGMPEGIIVRDLDSTILDSKRVPAHLRECGLHLPEEVWQSMPPFCLGARRLTHAMLQAHLAVVMSYLTRHVGVESRILVDIVEETWANILSSTTASVRSLVADLQKHASTVKCLLRMRLACSNRLLFR
jgi:Siderophore synthetase component